MPPLPSLVGAVDCHPYRLPLRAPFRGLTSREGVLLRGPRGWGEFAPFADYSPRQDAYWLAAAAEMMTGAVPPPRTDSVAVNAVLPDVSPADSAAHARRAVLGLGCRTVKLKVGAADPAEDLRRVGSVRAALDEVLADGSGRIRIDANGRWSPRQAMAALARLAPLRIEYVEQPCRTVAEIAEVRAAGTGVPIAVDEALRRDRQFTDLAAVADVAVVKVAPLGGGRAVLDLAAGLGVPVVVSSALESSVGVSRDARIAAALPQPPPDCGLGTGALLAADVVAAPLLPRDGRVGVDLLAPDPAALRAAAVPDPRPWLARVDAAWQWALTRGLLAAEDVALLAGSA